MADIILAGNANWSTCNGGGAPAAGDTIYLGSTGTTGYVLTLDGAENATYTCVAIHAKAGDNKTTPNNGTLAITNWATAPGPNLDVELYAGTATTLVMSGSSKINRIIKVVGGSNSSGLSWGLELYGSTVIKSITSVVGGTAHSGNAGVYQTSGTIESIGSITSSSSSRGMTITAGSIGNVTTATGDGQHGLAIGLTGSVTGTIANAVAGSVSGAHGVYMSNGTVASITTATGGSVTGAYPVYNNGGTITTITTATGGRAGHGVYNAAGDSSVTTAKGGTNANVYGVCWAGGNCTVNAVDLTNTGAPIGVASKLKLAPGCALTVWDVAGTAAQLFPESSGVAPASKIRKGVTRWGTEAGTLVSAPRVRTM